MVGLIPAGAVTLTKLIAGAPTSSLALAQEVQTASFLNYLAENIPIPELQEDLDRQVEQRIDILYGMVQITGDEVEGTEVNSHLECHT